MVDLDKLWIGDTVKLLASNRVGKYDGHTNGKARINVNGKIILTSPSNLSLHEEKETLYVDLPVESPIATELPKNEIDLHIDKLNPNLLNALPERIRDFQIAAAQTFIEQAIRHKFLSVEIIHGKGKGVLKTEVHHLLSLYDEVKFHVMGRDGGSTEVWFR